MTNNISDMCKKVIKIFSIVMCCCILTISLSALLYLSYFTKSNQFVSFDASKLSQAYNPIVILDNEGNQIAHACDIAGKKHIDISDLKQHTVDAFVCTEDKRFYKHQGIDITRMCSAFIKNVFAGRIKEGASTISQQLIKNTHLDNSKNMKRKINEILLACKMETKYSKRQILQMYLNTIFFGRGCYGIEMAAQQYFDVTAGQLTLSQSAVLAGLIKAPNVYAPDKNIDRCTQRRNVVLKLMLNQNVISVDEYLQALAEPIIYRPYQSKPLQGYAECAINQACTLLNKSKQQLLACDITIKTYCDANIQSKLEVLIEQDSTTDKQGKLADIGCVIASPDGKVRAIVYRGETAQQAGQVGSCLKPIVAYAPALDLGLINQASSILDEQTNFNGYCPTSPSGFHGWTTVKKSLVNSYNIPAVKVLNALTLKKGSLYLQRMGIPPQKDLSLALGNTRDGLTLLQLTRCYNTLSNKGVCNEISLIKSIYQNGKCIYNSRPNATKVYSPQASYLTTNMLMDVSKVGTAKALAKHDYQIACKTGTVGSKQGNSRAFNVAYTSSHTISVLYCGDFSNHICGGSAPTQLTSKVLDCLYKHPPKNFDIPNGLIKVKLNQDQLYNHQKMVVDNNGEEFWFDKRFLPDSIINDIYFYNQPEGNDQQPPLFWYLPQ